ncbi:MAG TPA: hypothetical protein O0X56_05400 [Methanocorpusculum sp.]|nr:hypothetical protein [Methanocorpusculum sp.]
MNTRMKFLEHELAEQEREQLRKAEQKEQPVPAAVPDNTLALERKVRELEALVNGLTEELLDLKSVTRRLSAQIEKLGGAPVKSHPENIVRGGIRKPEAEPAPAGRGIQAAAREAPAVPHAPAAVRQPIRRPVSAPAPQAVPERRISSPVPEPAPAPAPVEENVEHLKAGECEFVMQPDGTILKRRKTKAQNVIVAGTGYGPGRTSRSSAIRADSHAVIEADEDDTLDLDR